jgi:hypothetical protein
LKYSLQHDPNESVNKCIILTLFNEKSCLKIWSIQENYVPLQRQIKNHLSMNIAFYTQDIQRIFKENNCYYDYDIDFKDGTISVYVEWGDWKHDHIFLKHIMWENHYRQIEEVVTEEDGSDCYSATHYFKYGA